MILASIAVTTSLPECGDSTCGYTWKMEQKAKYRSTGRRRTPEPELQDQEPKPPPSETAADLDVDAILDEIDSVLEENAEEFVRGYVQKGGQ